ncbi:MAG: hypothetical protein P4L92_23080 [Rudaea sp.]|nr:hypothetical protein [Rudaea sp.]
MTHEAAKSVHLRVKSAGAPSDAQLALIRNYTLADMAADQLYVRSFALGHNCIDRDGEAFDEGLLTNFAASLPGKGAYIKHPTSWQGDGGPAEGRWFAANLQTMSLADARTFLREPGLMLPPDRNAVTLLMGDAYFAKTAENAPLLTKIDAGIAGDVSLGFSYDHSETIKDANGLELQATRLMGPGEALEGSLVWLGAQPGARAVKSANSTSTQREDSAMDLKEAQTQLAAAQDQVKTLTPAATFATELKTALGTENAALANDAKALAAAVVAGQKYRSRLITELVAHDRQEGVVGDKPEDVADVTASYGALSLAHLEKLHAAAEKNAKGGSQIQGSDPNAQRTDTKAAPEGSVLANPLLFNV